MSTLAWDEAKLTKGDEVIQMKKILPIYSYEDERKAIITDKKFCLLLRDELSKSKSLFYDSTDWLYKAKTEDRKFERQRDDFDILLDEIEVKANKWDEKIPQEFLELIMDYDWKLIQKARALHEDFIVLINNIHEFIKKSDSKEKTDMKMSIDVVIEKIDDITIMFKEREAAFDIRVAGFRDSFSRMKERIRRSV